jgi:ABC transporter substrate binding protein
MDVIVASSGNAVRAARQATTTIPIVMAPGAVSLVTSLARPGGNLTGLTGTVDDWIEGKRLELLKEVLPRMARVGVIAQPPRSGRPLAIAWKELPHRYARLTEEVLFRLPEGWDDERTWSVSTSAEESPKGYACVLREEEGEGETEQLWSMTLFPSRLDTLSDAAVRWAVAHEFGHIAVASPRAASSSSAYRIPGSRAQWIAMNRLREKARHPEGGEGHR